MAEIRFYAQGVSNTQVSDGGYGDITHEAGSGLGVFGSNIGVSVPVGDYQTTTFHTNGDGTDVANSTRLKNSRYVSDTGVSIDEGAAIELDKMCNFQAPLNIRFTHSEDVMVKTCRLRIFDRNDITKAASGVTTKAFETRRYASSNAGDLQLDHVAAASPNQSSPSTKWTPFVGSSAGDGDEMYLTDSPGVSGANTTAGDNVATKVAGYVGTVPQEGATHRAMRHDWYLAVSASPDSIGAKTSYGMYFTCEYL